jgi:hypothetical protein
MSSEPSSEPSFYDHCGLLPDFLRLLRADTATAETFDDIVDAAEERVTSHLPTYRAWPSVLLLVVDRGATRKCAARFAIIPMLWGVGAPGQWSDEAAREACALVVKSVPGVVGLILLGRVVEELDLHGWNTEGLVFLAISGDGSGPRHWASESVNHGPNQQDGFVLDLDGYDSFDDLLGHRVASGPTP